jgi:hypothetical protein
MLSYLISQVFQYTFSLSSRRIGSIRRIQDVGNIRIRWRMQITTSYYFDDAWVILLKPIKVH